MARQARRPPPAPAPARGQPKTPRELVEQIQRDIEEKTGQIENLKTQAHRLELERADLNGQLKILVQLAAGEERTELNPATIERGSEE